MNKHKAQVIVSANNSEEEGSTADIREQDISEQAQTQSLSELQEAINRVHIKLIDYTIKQKIVSDKVKILDGDKDFLKQKLEETIELRQTAIEKENFEDANFLNSSITQSQELIEQKATQILKLYEEYKGFESKKSQKFKQLSEAMHQALDKTDQMKCKQKLDKEQFETQELNSIQTQKKRLHYEALRMQENKKNTERESVKV